MDLIPTSLAVGLANQLMQGIFFVTVNNLVSRQREDSDRVLAVL